MSTETIVDIAALVGEMEAVPCQLSQHGTRPDLHSDDSASHYLRYKCQECGDGAEAFPACPKFVSLVRAGVWGECGKCKSALLSSDAFTILGPVSK